MVEERTGVDKRKHWGGPMAGASIKRSGRGRVHIAVAIAGLAIGCGGDADQRVTVAVVAASEAGTTQDREPLRPGVGFLFDSSERAGPPELLNVTAGFFVPDTGLILVDRTRIHIVDLSSGNTHVIGREGEGPEEFGRITHALRTPTGLAVWDILRHRVTFVSHDGEFLHSRRYLDVPFKGFANVRPVAIQPDGVVVFHDEVGGGLGEFEGRVRHPAQFVAVGSNGALEVIAESPGEEQYYQASGSRMSDAVLFGHRTLTAATGDRLIVAETQGGTVTVLDWSGREVGSIPMPANARPSGEQMKAAREAAAEVWRETKKQVTDIAAEGSIPFSPGGFEDFPTLPPDWPINEMAPPIDAVLTDFDARLWVRDYRLPDQDSVTWRVWDIEEEQLLFIVRMDGEDTMLDARGDTVLLRRLDDFDVPRVVVSRLRDSRE